MQPIPDVMQRTRRYWLIDGLPELFTGGALVLSSLILFAVRFLGASITGIALVIIPVLFLAGMLFGRNALDAIKTRTTYSRTGYVEYTGLGWSRLLVGTIIGFVISWALLAFLTHFSLPSQLFPVFTGALFALMMLFLGYFLGMRRFYALALFSLLVGGAASLTMDWYTGHLSVIGLTGAWLAVSGSMTFWRYLRTINVQEGAE
ncbi:MAG: hypothetical protein RMJ54_18510 [Roseiflexaceae bacterium]|nr:hypothetical protein [Roseiflexaceae bacterium]